MVLRSRLCLPVAIVGGFAAAALVPVAPALSEELPPPLVIDVEVVNTATVGARGSVAFVTVEFSWTRDPDFAFVSVQLAQRSGSGIAEGFGDAEVTCDGALQEATLPVTASGRAFKKGIAFASASGVICDFESCAEDQDAEEIQLVRA